MAIIMDIPNKLNSFICEHTAEFTLVPVLSKILNRRFSKVIPFYFWTTREGNETSIRIFPDLRGRLIALYARRPKVDKKCPGDIYVKINDALFEHAKTSEIVGVPVFAGVPIAVSLFELGDNCECLWYHLPGKVAEIRDECFKIHGVESEPDNNRHPLNAEGPLSHEKLFEIVVSKTQVFTWPACLDRIRASRSGISEWQSPFPFGAHYKPIYLFLLE